VDHTKAAADDLWSRGYFGCTSGNVTDDVIAEYVDKQDLTRDDEDFEVTQ
jgi:REP element-mobilizing transposase RayT